MPRQVPLPEPAPTTAALFAAARGGDRGALTELHRRFAGVVHGIALSRVGPVDADDVAQDVFLRLVRKIGSVRDADALPGWICAVARRAANDRLRRRRRHAHDPLADAKDERASHPSALDVLRRRVLAAIQELPEAYREPLILRLVEGLSGPLIAERTGRTPGSVRVNLHRGMALLRPRLAGEEWR